MEVPGNPSLIGLGTSTLLGALPATTSRIQFLFSLALNGLVRQHLANRADKTIPLFIVSKIMLLVIISLIIPGAIRRNDGFNAHRVKLGELLSVRITRISKNP